MEPERDTATRTEGRRPLYTEKQRNSIADDYDSGIPIKELTRKYKGSRATIYRVLKEVSQERETEYSKVMRNKRVVPKGMFDQKQIDIMVMLSLSGFSYGRIALLFDCAESTIQKYVDREQEERRKRARKRSASHKRG